MKLRELVDVLVLPNSFRNVDFSHKGVYTLSFRVHSKSVGARSTDPPEIICAYPTLIARGGTASYQLSSSFTIPETSQFRTKSFYISFNDESVHFDSGCLFRIEIECDKQPATELYLECFLLHYEVSHTDLSRLESIQPKDFVLRGVRLLRLNSPERNLCYHSEVVFNSMDYFSVVELSVVVCRLDYKLRLHNYQLSQWCLMDDEEKRKHSNTLQLFKLLPYDQLLRCTQKELGFMTLRETFTRLISSQLDNYERVMVKLRELLGDLSEAELAEFKQANKVHLNLTQTVPLNLKPLVMSLPENDQLLVAALKIRYQTEDTAEMRLLMLNESNGIARNIRFVWNMIVSIAIPIFRRRFGQYKLQQNKQQHRNIQDKYLRRVTCDRNKETNRYQKEAPLIEGLLPVNYKYPMFFGEDIEYSQRTEGESLVVFVHGFQGSEFDLQLVKNYIQAYYRECTCLMINSLEDETNGNIEVLGQRMAKEVERFIQRGAFEYKRINFVGYSLGGVIIRAGLRHLSAYKDRMNLLITLASPHLGISKIDNFLVNVGVWYMITFDKVKSLSELNHNDEQNTMLKLSRDESLGWFTKVVVTSSKEDNFVPNYSARIEPHNSEPFAMEAYNNIVRIAKEIVRIDVWFDSQGSTFDKMIGRKSHIEFLESDGFSELFFKLFGNLL